MRADVGEKQKWSNFIWLDCLSFGDMCLTPHIKSPGHKLHMLTSVSIMKHHKQTMDVKQKPKGLPAGRTRGHLWTSFTCSVWHVSTHVQADCGDHKHNKYGGCPHRAQCLDTDRRGIPCSCIVLTLSGAMSVSQLPPVWSRPCRSCVSLKPPLNHE